LPRVIARGAKLVWDASPREVMIGLCLQIVCGLGLGAQLLLGRRLIQAVVEHRPGDDLWDLAPELGALAAITAIVGAATTFLIERQRVLTALVERHTQDRVLDVVARVPLASFESGGFHDRLRRAVTNASERAWQVSVAIVGMFSALATVIPLAIVIMGIEPLLLPAIVVAYLPLHFATVRNGRSYYDFQYAMTTPDRERSYLGALLMGPAAVKEVRLFASAPWIRTRYDALYDRRIAELRTLINMRVRRSLIATAWSTLITIGGVALLVHWALDGRISTADAGVAAIAIQLAGNRIRTFGSSAGSLHECSLFLNDVVAFVDLPAEAGGRVEGVPAPTGFDTLRVDHLSFTYPGTETEVLHDVSLTIGKDEVVALVGNNGSGKTTLAKLLCGLYQPSAGRILWDDVDLGDCDPAAVRRNVAAAFQDFVRYELSGRHNIGLGDTARIDDDDAIRAAAAAVGADGPRSRLPEGLETRLSRAYEDGADLSIGEWQRVALARAFLRDAPLLVLDEPTASLDPHSERELFESVRDVQRGRALLLISHRFSSVRSADRVYVLDRGAVIESGTHDELMAAEGRYAEMFTLQAAAYGASHASRG
jgi:ATP-binding cassette subfamily B protein